KNTVIIMTSNIGSSRLVDAAERGSEAFEEAAERVRLQLREHFRPEFLNRVDEVIVFNPLTDEQLAKIVGLLLGAVRRRLDEAQIQVEITDAAMAHVAKEGYDPTYGARPLRRAIQREIENPLARAILGGEFAAGDTVRIDVLDGKIAFEKVTAAPPPRAKGGDEEAREETPASVS
ncbi:MAG: hypothetical protein E6I62_09915, partial [Chloroflexi bacterium]